MYRSSKIFYFSLGSFVTAITLFFMVAFFTNEVAAPTDDLQTPIAPRGQIPFLVSTNQFPPVVPTLTPGVFPPYPPDMTFEPRVVQEVDLSPYTVAYLADEATLMGDPLFSASNLFGQYAHSFTQMSDLETFAAQNPLDVLVIHISAQEQVNPAWVTDYVAGKGVVFVTLDVPAAERRKWSNIDCDREGAVTREHEQTGEHYAYTGRSLVQSESEISKAEAIQHMLTTNCTNEPPAPPVPVSEEANVYISSGSTVTYLNTETGILELRQTIYGHVWDVNNSRENFANRDLPPTQPPGFPGT